jgi:hypothetical protein
MHAPLAGGEHCSTSGCTRQVGAGSAPQTMKAEQLPGDHHFCLMVCMVGSGSHTGTTAWEAPQPADRSSTQNRAHHCSIGPGNYARKGGRDARGVWQHLEPHLTSSLAETPRELQRLDTTVLVLGKSTLVRRLPQPGRYHMYVGKSLPKKFGCRPPSTCRPRQNPLSVTSPSRLCRRLHWEAFIAPAEGWAHDAWYRLPGAPGGATVVSRLKRAA